MIIAPSDKFEEVQVDEGTEVTPLAKLSPNFWAVDIFKVRQNVYKI